MSSIIPVFEDATDRAIRHAAEARAAVSSDPAFGGPEVLAWMRRLCPFHEWAKAYPEMSSGIAEAAIDHPLSLASCSCHPPTERDEHHRPLGVSPEKWDDIRMTAAFLTALAWTESAFQPNLVPQDGSARFGLFLIQASGPDDDATPLLLPRTAAAAALERLRAQVTAAQPGEPLERVLVWYADHAEGPLSLGSLPELPTTTAIVPCDEYGFPIENDAALARSRCRLDLASWLLSEGT